jgi:uncharacterized protein YukE
MSDELRVDLTALRHAGSEIGRHGEELHALQQAGHAGAEQAQSGWVGSSASALAELLDGWATASMAQLRRRGAGRRSVRRSAAFALLEQRNTTDLAVDG